MVVRWLTFVLMVWLLLEAVTIRRLLSGGCG
jgi:hypothetical protein